MSQTAEDICNLTLAYLGKTSDERILNLAQPTNGAEKTFAPIFTPTLKQELRKHPWNCAKTTMNLSMLNEVLVGVAKPYQYDLPGDYVAGWRDKNDEWERRRGQVVSAYKDTLPFTYIALIGANECDDLLVEAVARSMQKKLSRPYTKQNTEWQSAKLAYDEAIDEAKRANGFENGPVDIDYRLEEGNWLGDRFI